MLFGVCIGPCYKRAKDNLLHMESHIDGAEIRLDTFRDVDSKKIEELLKGFTKKILFTYRTREGKEHLIPLWKSLLSLRPDFVDLDYTTEEEVRELILSSTLGTKLILSYHDHTSTNDIRSIFDTLIQMPSHMYKMATFAKSAIDSLKMLELVKHASEKKIDFTGLCMGEYGAITRILAPVFGSSISYACSGEHKSAPGQIKIDDLLSIYNYKKLSKTTAVYALIGDPVDHSIGHLVHNYLFARKGFDAVYVKIPIRKEEVSEFFSFFRRLDPFKGLSITMPLKECCVAYVDTLGKTAAAIGAINTVAKKNGCLHGDNTDCDGALIAIEKVMDIEGKEVLILGSGGAAKALAHGFKNKGAFTWVIARNAKSIDKMVEMFSCRPFSEDAIEFPTFHLVVNTLPSHAPMEYTHLWQTAVAVMDISYTVTNKSIYDCSCMPTKEFIFGLDMFLYQLYLQHKIWRNTLIVFK